MHNSGQTATSISPSRFQALFLTLAVPIFLMFHKLFYPRQSTLLCAALEGKSNVTAVDWLMPVSIKPPMLALALNNKSYSLEMISRSKEFSISVMPDTSKEMVMQVGSTTGRVIDKVDEYQVKLSKAQEISAPLVFGAIGSVECRVLQLMSGGDHTVVLGEVVAVHFPEDEDAKKPLLFNWGSKTYFGMSKDLVREPEKKDKEPAKDKENGSAKEGKENGSPKERETSKPDKGDKDVTSPAKP